MTANQATAEDLRRMLDEGVGENGWCQICSKERERVRPAPGGSCLDCRIHYGTANELDRIVHRELERYHATEVAPLARLINQKTQTTG